MKADLPWHEIVGMIADSIMVFDHSEHLIWANSVALSLLGYSAEEVVLLQASDLIGEVNSERDVEEDLFGQLRVVDLFRRGLLRGFVGSLIGKSKERFAVVISTSVVIGNNRQELIVCMAHDARPMREASRQIESERLRSIGSSKMAALGLMAAGIAHEIRSPLTVIDGAARLILNELGPDFHGQRTLDMLPRIGRAVQHIEGIMHSLAAFSRDGTEDPLVATTINDVIQNAWTLCRTGAAESEVQFVVETLNPGFAAMSRPSELTQVLVNLIGNACDAIAQLADPWVKVQVAHDQAEGMIEIRVSNSGPGIPPKIRDKLFVPFFTTKPPGKGTGLGLSLSSGLIESQGGSLSLDANHEHTCFVIKLKSADFFGPSHMQSAS